VTSPRACLWGPSERPKQATGHFWFRPGARRVSACAPSHAPAALRNHQQPVRVWRPILVSGRYRSQSGSGTRPSFAQVGARTVPPLEHCKLLRAATLARRKSVDAPHASAPKWPNRPIQPNRHRAPPIKSPIKPRCRIQVSRVAPTSTSIAISIPLHWPHTVLTGLLELRPVSLLRKWSQVTGAANSLASRQALGDIHIYKSI